TERRMRGRAGLLMQGRYPKPENDIYPTANRYSVFQGFDFLFEEFEDWLSRRTGNRVHGHLFSRERVAFAGGAQLFNGCLSDSAALRDYNPQAFLSNLIWNTRGEHQCFMFGPSDAQEVMPFISADQNAQLSIISGAWAIPLFHSDRPFTEIRKEAAFLQRVEAKQLSALRQSPVKARVKMWSLAEFIEDPMERLQMILDELGGGVQRRLSEVPKMADLSGFGAFLQKLKNQGMSPYLMGDFPMFDEVTQAERQDDPRPFLVK
ncbi:MAG: glycosyl transferase, partial [Litoreibacter sp.]|nr:glycosyl transferase [Litoreibacter sp.]